MADGVATVTLNRPEKLNALNTVMLDELLAALDLADADDGVRAVDRHRRGPRVLRGRRSVRRRADLRPRGRGAGARRPGSTATGAGASRCASST